MVECDREGCEQQARWLAYAAYDVNGDLPHPQMARYAEPMVRACSGEHMMWELGRDAASVGTTRQWVVTPA